VSDGYVETLADLALKELKNRTHEREVQIIAGFRPFLVLSLRNTEVSKMRGGLRQEPQK
jgi:hypothetical protein